LPKLPLLPPNPPNLPLFPPNPPLNPPLPLKLFLLILGFFKGFPNSSKPKNYPLGEEEL
jgi:hypothetical protein